MDQATVWAGDGMRYVGPLLLALVFVAVGLLFLIDYRGISTGMRASADSWWQAGPIRRRLLRLSFFRARTMSMRVVGGLWLAMGLFVILGLLFGTKN
jgi:hypothetical protein